MNCCICDAENSKYKCPKCTNSYCSVSCCKKHKDDSCSPIEHKKDDKLESSNKKIDYEYETDDTVPLEKLALLEKSDSLKSCLRNPHLKELLLKLDSYERPERLIQKFMQEPIFLEFADECLKVIEP